MGPIEVNDSYPLPENLKPSSSYGEAYQQLLSGTPARAEFPRGFLWDEGFHQQVICKWDAQLCQHIISSWLHTMDPSGWIPREQIRGDEVRGKTLLTKTDSSFFTHDYK